MRSNEQDEVADQKGGQCVFCEGRTFRRSRLQLKDLLPLLVMRYPVRCMSCSKRQRVGLGVSRRAMSSKTKQMKATPPGEERRAPSTVGGTSFSALPVHQPMTMPDLHGVTLAHHTSLPESEESGS